jgi:hypothetical protein
VGALLHNLDRKAEYRSKSMTKRTRRNHASGFKANVALAALNKLVESASALTNSNGTISLLVSGYDNDPRELHTILEVRVYFQALDAQFPYWFHVCTRIDHSLRMLFMMLVELKPVTMAGAVRFQFANDDLHAFLLQRLQAMDSLHAKHGFSEEKSLRITELVMNYFESVIDDSTQRII